MTTKDLRLEYKNETGKYPAGDEYSLGGDLSLYDGKYLIDYINWLEDDLLQLRNQLGINERAKNKIKTMK